MEIDSPERDKAVYKLWKAYINDETPDLTLLSRDIRRSWQLSKHCGIDPYFELIPPENTRTEAAGRIWTNRLFLRTCTDILRHLNEIMVASDFWTCIFDKDGYFLKQLTGEYALPYAANEIDARGVCFQTSSFGTNAIGLVLETQKPSQVMGAEHYHYEMHGYTTAAAPIFSPENELIGGVGGIMPKAALTPYNIALSSAAAMAATHALKDRQTLQLLDHANQFKNAVFESVKEGLVALDETGLIILMNKRAQRLFNVKGSPSGLPMEKVIGNIRKNASFLNALKKPGGIIDTPFDIEVNKRRLTLTMTRTLIHNDKNHITGTLISLNEMKRARSMATTMIGAHAELHFDNIVGKSPCMIDCIRLAKQVASGNSNILLQGESGCGKDVFAQAIHNEGPGKKSPFIAVNCAAIPRELMASELFGYTEGAFTGSKRGGNRGKFELADGGTLFLDEIGEIPLDVQAILLRVLEDRTITRLGSSVSNPIDIRIIAATNKKLRDVVEQGMFREDLYFRLNVIMIEIPPLRVRLEDIPSLTEHFVEQIGWKLNKVINHIDNKVFQVFSEYAWPGNVREIQNVIEYMINLATTDTLSPDLLPSRIFKQNHPNPGIRGHASLVELEKDHMIELLNSGLNRKQVAKKLGISRSTLYRKIERYKLG